MTLAPAVIFKIPTESAQPAPGKAARPSGSAQKAPAGRSPVLASGNGPRSTTAELPRLPAVSGRADTPVRVSTAAVVLAVAGIAASISCLAARRYRGSIVTPAPE